MKRTLLALLLVAALAGTSIVTLAQDALTAGTTEGSLTESTAAYTLTAEEGDVFFIALTSADFDTLVQVTDSEETVVVSNDDGGVDTNSQVLFIAPAAGTYTVSVSAYNGNGTGAYTLVLVDDVVDLSVGTPAVVTMDGTTPGVFQFEAPGGALNITADSGDTVDTSLSVIATFGYEVEANEDFDGGVDPALTPAVLSEGTYYLTVTPASSDAVGDVTVSLEAGAAIALSAEPTVITFSEGSSDNIATFDVEEGTTYEIVVGLSQSADFSISLDAQDDDLYTYGYFSFSAGVGGSYQYLADITGTISATVSAGFVTSDDSIDYTITVTPVE